MNPNLVGLVSLMVWGASVPVAKFLMGQIGMLAVIGFIQAFCGVMGLLRQRYLVKTTFDKAWFKNPYLYGRWFFFCAHVSCIFTACGLVSVANIPLVILLNYFWPTAIILCSIRFAGVHVTRPPFLIAGLILVVASLALEILSPHSLNAASLFSDPQDVTAYCIAFVGAWCWGMYSALSRKGGEQSGGGAVVPLFQITLSIALPLSFIPGNAAWDNLELMPALLLTVYAALQMLAYMCWDYGMRRGNIVFLSLCADFMVWISLGMAYLLLNASLGLTTVISGVMLVAGAMITRYGTLQKAQAQAKDQPAPVPTPD
jgi:drug/metabolite transporter (DMT)-like permease